MRNDLPMEGQETRMVSKSIGRVMVALGALGLVLGTGPLIVICILDPKSNAIGLGLLFVFSFPPSVLLLGAGSLVWLAGCGVERRQRAGVQTI